MIPAAFDYVRAVSLTQAIDLLGEDPDSTKLLAGGHTLIPTLKLRLNTPARVVDISGLSELKGIEIGDTIRIGALTRHADLLASKPLRDILPIFHEAADMIADPQVRNRGTIGGSLANADPSADWPAVVLALRGEIEIAGPRGNRRVPAREFFVDIMTTALEPDEVLVAIHLPKPAAGTRYRYRKIRHPASGYAVVGVAAAIQLRDGKIADATLGITGATGHAYVPDEAITYLKGRSLDADTIQAAAEKASSQAECLEDRYASADYRRNLIRTEVARALRDLAG
jgi:carbon-monoxide dehydrogenase medium subunit